MEKESMMYKVVQTLQKYIQNNFNTYLITGLDALNTDNVLLTDIDTDKYKSKLMIYIKLDGATYQYEDNTLDRDDVTISPEIYILNRGYDKDTLSTNVIKYADVFVDMIRADYTLEDNVDMCVINNIEYYEGVGADENIKAVKISLVITYEDVY